ncbi:hypothetical protein RP20_CCG019894 [Aedes albopictus]|nr:hypothetical protein RP20_CCG019894 [Aedes albopictus]
MVNPDGHQDGSGDQGNGSQAGSRRQANSGGRLPGSAVSLPVREVLRGSENYSSWSFATKMILIKERAWCAVKERLDDDPVVSDEVSEQALATICLSIDPKIYGLVRNAKTAKEAWDSLRNTYVHVARQPNSFQLWHRRLGHLSASGMMRLKSIATGMKFEDENLPRCVPCIQGKHQRQPFKAIGHRAGKVLELVHSDLCGPMETASLGGSRYILTFIDDASRKAFVYFLKSKTDVLEAFEDFKSYVENQTGERIKRIRTDNGKEDVNRGKRESTTKRRFRIIRNKTDWQSG